MLQKPYMYNNYYEINDGSVYIVNSTPLQYCLTVL